MRDTEGWDPSGRPLKSTKKLIEVDGRMVVTGVTEVEVGEVPTPAFFVCCRYRKVILFVFLHRAAY